MTGINTALVIGCLGRTISRDGVQSPTRKGKARRHRVLVLFAALPVLIERKDDGYPVNRIYLSYAPNGRDLVMASKQRGAKGGLHGLVFL